MPLKKLILLALVLFSYSISVTHANKNGINTLFIWLDSFNSISGTFSLAISNKDHALGEESTGVFSALKPDYFLWHQTIPDDQVVLSDAEFIWHYDRDLETVTRREISHQISSLQLLLGNSKSIDNDYDISEVSAESYDLIPRDKNFTFRSVRLNFTGAELYEIEIIDRLGQEQKIKISNVRYDSSLTPADFKINMPENVERLYDENY